MQLLSITISGCSISSFSLLLKPFYMNLVIDIGNTAIKTGWFDDDKLLEKQHQVTIDGLKQLINSKKPSNVIASSTGKEIFQEKFWDQVNIYRVDEHIKWPFRSKYATPKTLGADRIAGVAGAKKIFPAENVLVIDLGTCVTYDYISEAGIYYGGAISPGVKMRFRSMNEFTSRLPDLDIPEEFPEFLGDSTANSMKSGVMNGLLYEMSGMIAAYKNKFGKIKIILTGGDAQIFEKKIKEPIFASPDLVLIGLNVILQHNVESS